MHMKDAATIQSCRAERLSVRATAQGEVVRSHSRCCGSRLLCCEAGRGPIHPQALCFSLFSARVGVRGPRRRPRARPGRQRMMLLRPGGRPAGRHGVRRTLPCCQPTPACPPARPPPACTCIGPLAAGPHSSLRRGYSECLRVCINDDRGFVRCLFSLYIIVWVLVRTVSGAVQDPVTRY
jgi:hypothetical protein